ncbi:MAG: DNA-binding protein [Candidatus Thermoplasmatota archaeon]|jgi:predicted DNA-binding protein with PD1-like motif|nr:DNA-binding protein [Candidatus Thermoplasmatota archaeon]MCL5983981.1 DNA-binding protein [Candidatus Thermoplasmatota archaeon]
MQKYRDGPRLAVKLDSGEDFVSSILQIAEEEKVTGAFITSGIGMLRGTRIGYFIGDRYDERTYEQPHELVSLQGSLAIIDGKPHLHVHAALANRSHDVVGGHLFQGTVHVVVELLLTVFEDKKFGRTQSGPLLTLLDLEPTNG